MSIRTLCSGPKLGLLALAMVLVLPVPAHAGATFDINDDTKLELGLMLQTLGLSSNNISEHGYMLDRYYAFRMRRARARLKLDYTQWISVFMQTETAAETGTGLDLRLIDAWVEFKPHSALQLRVGEHLVPSLRQSITSPAALLGIDRPSIAYKALTWGVRTPYNFANTTLAVTDSGLRGAVDVRDLGATLYGNVSLSSMLHLKYYGGIYNGVHEAGGSEPRLSARLQLNILDAEPAYVLRSTYEGKKKTLALAISYDWQHHVDDDAATGKARTYGLLSADVFAEHEVGPGSFNFEMCFAWLELGDNGTLRSSGRSVQQIEGIGFSAQSGYLVFQFQPWVGFERWSSGNAQGDGSYWVFRTGINYLLWPPFASIKAGYELFWQDRSPSQLQRINSFVVGLYLSY